MNNKILTIKIQLDENDTASKIMELVTEIMDETNDKGYGIIEAAVDDMTVFNLVDGFSDKFIK